ncbi:MAG: flagellin lysine-N-methylase [Bryobacteraceae bacterium]
MPAVHMVRQPRCFDRFRCIGAACEDTCCKGWAVPVDRDTWEKYQSLPDFRIAGAALSSLVEINPASSSSIDYARMRLEGTGCPALLEGLCSIQQTLGEPYIPDLCSTYPRVLNLAGATVEKSFHLSCPETARLVLSDPEAMVLREHMEELLPHRAGSLTEVAGAGDERLNQVRELVIRVIQERSLPLWQRIASLEFALERLACADLTRAVMIMESHLSGMRQGLFAGIFAGRQAVPALQIETVVELIVARIGADYTSPRFLDCYREFMSGLAWTKESTMEELAARYQRASELHFQPFVRRHEHLLENYLINYVFRTLFPYRRKQPNGTFAIDSGGESMKNAFLLLLAHYAIVRTVLIGMAALHKDDLGLDHAIKLVQSYSKAFLHSSSFEAVVIESLGNDTKFPTHKIMALVMD